MIDIFKIKFEGDLVGRGQRINPFNVVAADQNQLRSRILQQVMPKLPHWGEADINFSYVPNEGLSGLVVVGGWRPVGQFTVTLTEGTKE
jgi:hypothetical protein